MSLSPHLESHRLATALQRCLAHAIPWAGDVFRFTDLTYANLRDLRTGEGSRKAGGRWNPKGSFRTMYFSLDPETALSEVLAYRRYQGLPDAEATPLVLVSCQANVRQILDLSDRRIRQLLGLSQNQLVTEPWRALQHAGREALTQAIGRLARKAGLEGLLTPSAARPRGMNLVLFRDRVSENQLSIVHPEKFPMSRRQRRP